MTTVVTDRAAFRRAAADAPPGARVPIEVQLSIRDPFDAYRRARAGSGGVYLATTGGQAGWGYFAVDPIQRLQVGPDAVVQGRDSRGPTLAALAGLLDSEHLIRGDCDVPYPCGAFGWLSYDIARELEDLPGNAHDDRGLPRLQVGVYDTVAAWEEPRPDHAIELRITACPRIGSSDDFDVVYDRGLAKARSLVRRIEEGDPEVGNAPAPNTRLQFESETGGEAYADRVRRVKAYVRDGDTFQANVSHRLAASAGVHPVEAFEALRRVNPAPYSALVEFPGVDLVSASPELLLSVADDRIITEPIAGTRPRSDASEEDAALEQDLRTDEKERAEHAMLVDLERNDLGKVSTYGSVEVSEYRRVDRYSEVMHLVSKVEGQLHEDANLVDAIAAVFPGGTITGAPKPRTMEIIDELETTRRGPYTGSIGVFGFDGRATLNIVIRTLVRHADDYHLRVGAGIVHDSEPEREYDETLDKARALITAVDEALAGSIRMEVQE